MGVRQVRFCDLSGSEEEVALHELQIDQMRVELDLAAPEYRKLLELLQPYIDAGRVEAAVSSLPSRRGRGSNGSGKLTPEERERLRVWAERKGIPVPSNNRFKSSVVEQWRQETGAE